MDIKREKSLSHLCEKFLASYPVHVNESDPLPVISLDIKTKELMVERRRIYDIVNVLESVEILSRQSKNQYTWHGFNRLEYTLSKLKTLAVKSNFLEYAKTLMATQLEQVPVKLNKRNVPTRDAFTQTLNITREERSLGVMSQKFLMLFLTAEDGLVSLNFAARILLGDTQNDTTELGRLKTKIRRLYDIANVLICIGLIQKYQYTDTNISRPAYRYIGPQVQVLRDVEYIYHLMNMENPRMSSKHSLFDLFARNYDLKYIIPKFDVDTGVLSSKEENKEAEASKEGIKEEANEYYGAQLVAKTEAEHYYNTGQFETNLSPCPSYISTSSSMYQPCSMATTTTMTTTSMTNSGTSHYEGMFAAAAAAASLSYYHYRYSASGSPHDHHHSAPHPATMSSSNCSCCSSNGGAISSGNFGGMFANNQYDAHQQHNSSTAVSSSSLPGFSTFF